jgi:predicted metal-dependent TIM-barrel fold hydrolase
LCINPKEAEDPGFAREVIAIIPDFLDKPNVLGIGEIGLNKNSRNELIISRSRSRWRTSTTSSSSCHTPHLEDKLKGTKLIIDAIKRNGNIDLGRVLIDHVEEHTVEIVLNAGFWAGMTLYPDTKCTPQRAGGHLEMCGTERLWINSAGDWGHSDPLAVPKCQFGNEAPRPLRSNDLEGVVREPADVSGTIQEVQVEHQCVMFWAREQFSVIARNVHAGTTLDETKQKLRDDALKVKQRVSPNEPMGVGLWLSARVASELLQQRARPRVCAIGCATSAGSVHIQRLSIRRFPWRCGEACGLSTAVVGFASGAVHADLGEDPRATASRGRAWEESRRCRWAGLHGRGMMKLSPRLRRFSRVSPSNCRGWKQDTGRTIHLDIEPEPGCLIGDSAGAVSFFQNHLLNNGNEDVIRHHVRVCHDICHAAVMFEDQEKAFETYRNAGNPDWQGPDFQRLCARI